MKPRLTPQDAARDWFLLSGLARKRLYISHAITDAAEGIAREAARVLAISLINERINERMEGLREHLAAVRLRAEILNARRSS